MATTESLRFRRSAAQLHALAGVKREIRVNDRHGRRKYLEDFTQAFRSYESVLDRQQLTASVNAADIILIGDYHALAASQRFAATLLEERAYPGDRPVVLGVEAIFVRDQHILDEWWRREIDEEELRRRIRYDLDWGYDWPPFYELLVTAREHADALYGLDCMPRGDLRNAPLHDRHAAEKISELSSKHPDAVVMVLFGESHLAPGHMPRLLREKLSQTKLLTVLQNVDEMYWRATGETCESVESVGVSEAVVCVFNSTPLEKYESYRLCLERWGENDPDSLDLTPTVYNLLNTLVRFLGINQYSPYNCTQPKFLVDMLPEVYCNPSDAHLREVVQRQEDKLNILLTRLEERGCAYVPACNTLYVREFRMAYAAEEVARFLRHACLGLPVLDGLTGPDAEHAACGVALESCLADFGSRILCPSRAEATESNGCDGAAALERLLLRTELSAGNTAVEANLRQLGYAMGRDLYDAYLGGRVGRPFLRSIFLSDMNSSRETCKSVFRKVRFPKIRRHR
jgi:hypothetical protein